MSDNHAVVVITPPSFGAGEWRPLTIDPQGYLRVAIGAANVTLTVSDIEIGGVYLKDGSNTNRASISSGGALKVDASASTQPVSAAALPLPSGAATSAAQATAQTSLSSLVADSDTLVSGQTLSNFYLNEIDTKLTSPLTVATHAVTGTFWQATQPVSGTFWQSTQPVSIAGTVPVSGSFWQATQPVSIAALPVGHNIIDSGTITTITNAVSVTGTFFQATQPISAAALPLPTNAAIETGGNLATIAAAEATGNVSLAAIATSAASLDGKTNDLATGSRQDAMLAIAQALAQLILNCDTSSVTIASGQITISAMPPVSATVQGSVAVLSQPLPPNAAQETAGNLDLISAALLRLNTAISNLDANVALQNRLMASLVATHGGVITDYIN